ncbi:MAG: hypothetical protein AAB654_09525, partial [Acidobacteriota bacterium]
MGNDLHEGWGAFGEDRAEETPEELGENRHLAPALSVGVASFALPASLAKYSPTAAVAAAMN